MKVLFINGPNLNMLGTREEDVYGSLTLDQINEKILSKANELKIDTDFFQSNVEGNLVSKIQESSDFDYIVINPAAFTHTSIAIRDALLSIKAKFIEVHLSNIYSREDFRHNSYVSSIAIGVISGFGFHGYLMALDYILSLKD
ncbi:MAG: type II 3-dehydroquinate dehydratase [Deltaproteobacteria bacterium TMED126]|jgi:3-dehydroquinate dehydratase-2|nr:type II 3-dehydroquinate dehydratase [Deltaproteobacteria bacterium TMED126]NSW98142.1 type II 3-dehydroquinate dehydratase [bacterium]|tara:strand:+ start:134 stop:562 length:429 start_codon:yes stop_codon:yes gene_type:complete